MAVVTLFRLVLTGAEVVCAVSPRGRVATGLLKASDTQGRGAGVQGALADLVTLHRGVER